MNEQEFLEKMADLLDCEEEIGMESVLEEIEEWDSLSLVSFLAMMNKYCKKKVEPVEVRSAITIQDLFYLTQGDN